MTQSVSDATRAIQKQPFLRTMPALVLGGLTAGGVLLLLLLDRVQVQRYPELGHVEFGMPLNWVIQEQSVDPPLPYSTSLMSPWENPTSVQFLPLGIDLVLVAVFVTACWMLLRAVLAKRSA